MMVVIEGTELPGRRCGLSPDGYWYENVHVGLCNRGKDTTSERVIPTRPWAVTSLVVGDATSARWQFEVTTKEIPNGMDFLGTFVRGARDDRHIGLAWGEVPGDGTFHLFRVAKLRLDDIPRETIKAAMTPGDRLVGRLGLTDAKGQPRCARVRPPDITWRAEPA